MVFGSCDLNQDSPPSVTDFAQAQGGHQVLDSAKTPETDVSGQQDFVIPRSEKEKL